jgi:stage II sporulation protein E
MRSGSGTAEIREAIGRLCFIGLQRGAVNFLDLPSTMTVKCARLNTVLSTVNTQIEQIKLAEKTRQNLDASKVLMAGLLSGISTLCKSFADDICSGVVFDGEKARDIKDELLYAGIAASDCLITKTGGGEYAVSVLVQRADSGNRLIEQVISRVIKHKMQVSSIDDGETAGFSIVTVKTAPRYGLVFGVAQQSKNFNQKNGDTFSFLKITDDKTMMAVCDGMGTGERAQQASVLALSLVENFYKAGFPNEIIMSSVNQLLTITNQEIFSALDVAVFNLADGGVNFIKVGAADSFIKRAREVEIVEAGSLPLGIVEEMTPKITRAVLDAGDIVVLCSDGVGDSFGDRTALANFVNNLILDTPQKIADEIIAECLNRTSKIAADDCTVIVAKIT